LQFELVITSNRRDEREEEDKDLALDRVYTRFNDGKNETVITRRATSPDSINKIIGKRDE
jgi:hypothetical protein